MLFYDYSNYELFGILLLWLQKEMLTRHRLEASMLHSKQRMDWAWKMDDLNMIDPSCRNPEDLDNLYIPRVIVEDFVLLSSKMPGRLHSPRFASYKTIFGAAGSASAEEGELEPPPIRLHRSKIWKKKFDFDSSAFLHLVVVLISLEHFSRILINALKELAWLVWDLDVIENNLI